MKNTIGPKAINESDIPDFLNRTYGGNLVPKEAPLDLAADLVFGAVDYPRGLGFEPYQEFTDVAACLGPWTGPSAITFGRNGRPFFVAGPRDNPDKIMATFRRTPGSADNFDLIAPVVPGDPSMFVGSSF